MMVLRLTSIALVGLVSTSCVSHWRGQEMSADIEMVRAQLEQQLEDQRKLRKKLEQGFGSLEVRFDKIDGRVKRAISRLQDDSLDSDSELQGIKDEIKGLKGEISKLKYESLKSQSEAPVNAAAETVIPETIKLPTKPKELYEYGYDRKKEKDCKEAVRAFLQLYNKFPKYKQTDSALYLAAKCQYQNKKPKEAIRHLNVILTKYKKGRKVDDALELTHDAFRRINKCKTALVFIEELVDEYPTYKYLKRAKRKLKKTKKKCGD